jgi:hypothetical protein
MSVVETLLEIKIAQEDDFLKIKETLTRIGVASRKDKKLYQSCHILHKQGKFYIVHFKEMFALDGKPTDFSEEDLGRRNTIAKLLEDWGLLSIVAPATMTIIAPMNIIKIISFKDKSNWELVQKYAIGKRK